MVLATCCGWLDGAKNYYFLPTWEVIKIKDFTWASKVS
jgi:hypothetical protein